MTFRQIAHRVYTLGTPAQRRQFWLLFALNAFMGAFEMGVAGGVSLLGIAMASPESLVDFPYMATIFALLPFPDSVPQSLRALILILSLLCCAIALKNALYAYLTWRQSIFSQHLSWDFGRNLFQQYICAPYAWYTQQNSSDLYLYLSWKIYVGGFALSIQMLLTQLVIVLALVGGSLVVNAPLTLLLFCCTGVLAIVIHRYSREKVHRVASEICTYEAYNTRTCMQSIQGMREIAIYEKRQAFLNDYGRYIAAHVVATGKQILYPSIPQWIMETVGMLLLLVVLCLATYWDFSTVRATGILVFLAAISWRLLPASNKMLSCVINLRSYMPVLGRLFKETANIGQATPLFARREIAFESQITLQKIRFTYPQGTSPALNDVTITIPKGKMVGLVGLSGSGKSTISSIITGLQQADEGSILVDGKPWDASTERFRIGYVPQALYILDTTLAENVAFSRWGEPIDPVLLERCCAMAAMNFIRDLPDGMETVLGERGVRLSGGQIQRVGIARALYAEPDILIFDEATSALDGATESAIQSTINTLRDNITLVLIAHRLSTVADCDIIYWIDNGRVRASGTPAEVLPQYEAMMRSMGLTSETSQQQPC